MNYYLGIDQGGTKTAAIVCDQRGVILGSALSPGLVSTYFQDSDETYIKNIRIAAEEACGQAGINLSDISSVCGSLNGADWDFEYPVLKRKLIEAVGCQNALVVNDCIGAMRGGTDSKEFAVVCAGSGLNVAVRCEDGREIIYGYYIADEDQGGSALGRAVLRKVMDAHLGLCEETKLTGLTLAFTGHSSAEELMIDLSMQRYALQPKDLAICLLQALRQGDAQSIDITDRFAQSVSRYVIAGLKRFQMLEHPVPVVFSGSVFKDIGTLVSSYIFKYIQQASPQAVLVNASYEPVCGSVLLLFDKDYPKGIPKAVMHAFEQSSKKWNLLRNCEF